MNDEENINNVRLALLEQKVLSMEKAQDNIQQNTDEIKRNLNLLLLQVTEARGGWKMLILLISMVGGFGAIIGFLTGKTVGT